MPKTIKIEVTKEEIDYLDKILNFHYTIMDLVGKNIFTQKRFLLWKRHISRALFEFNKLNKKNEKRNKT